MQPDDSLYTLADLEEATGFHARRIRNWIQTGVLPAPHGRGPGPHYGEEHLQRLRFIQRLPNERIPIEFLRQVFEEVPRETIRRVAAGEEPVSLFGVGDTAPTSEENRTSGAFAAKPDAATRPQRKPRRRTRTRPETTPWTTIEIEDGLELRLRGDDPDRVAWLARLARKLREWVAQQE